MSESGPGFGIDGLLNCLQRIAMTKEDCGHQRGIGGHGSIIIAEDPFVIHNGNFVDGDLHDSRAVSKSARLAVMDLVLPFQLESANEKRPMSSDQ